MNEDLHNHEGERIARLVEASLSRQLSRRELIRYGLTLGLSLPAVSMILAACGIDPSARQTRASVGDGTVSRWQPSATVAQSGAAEPTSAVLSGSFQAAPPPERSQVAMPMASASTGTSTPTRFAVIGDYGMEGDPEAAVAALVASWQPEFIITLGDNNYPEGSIDTIDRNIGQYYAAFISPYKGAYGPGAERNRFFPVLGNHDWIPGYPEPYLSYFSLPGNERYYSFTWGPLAIFALDSMPGEPDGWTSDSLQAQWLQRELAGSTARWKLVLAHHPPFSSGYHGSNDWMQWPFAAWGAHLVMAGHDHSYERIQRDGITYVVNGLGGAPRYAPGGTAVEGSQIFYSDNHGALQIEADQARLVGRFIIRSGEKIDEFSLK